MMDQSGSLAAYNGAQHPAFLTGDQHQRTGNPHSAFLLGSPPLAALHNMTEMKTPPTTTNGHSHHNKTGPVFPQATSPFSSNTQNGYGVNPLTTLATSTCSSNSNYSSANNNFKIASHNIADILCRSAAAAASVGNMPGSLEQLQSQINANMQSMYLNSQSARYPKPIADLPGRSPIYWPGAVLQNAALRAHGKSFFKFLIFKFIVSCIASRKK